MKRTYSTHRRRAQKLAEWAAEREPRSGVVGVGVALVFALLEVAFQIGRVADNVPVWGPPDER